MDVIKYLYFMLTWALVTTYGVTQTLYLEESMLETTNFLEWTSDVPDSDNESSLEAKHDNYATRDTSCKLSEVQINMKCQLTSAANKTYEKVRYDKHKVYTLYPTKQEQTDALLQLENDPKGLNFWTLVRPKSPVEIMASEEQFPFLAEFMKNNSLNYTIHVNDVQKLIDAQLPPNPNDDFSWNYFYDLNKIYHWMDLLGEKYSHVLTPLTIGCSYEGRPIKGFKLSHKVDNPGIFIEAGTHAREWIAVTTALWILNELLTSNDTKIQTLAENYDWYIFPSVNPDGYQYSYETDRFWRKTRSPVPKNCTGVDTNRNWNFHWAGGGDPCSMIYPGLEPFSEIETCSLAQYVSGISDKIQVYLDFHSYSQILMFPYSYTTTHSKDYDNLIRIAKKSAEALENVNGIHYIVGDIASTVYIADGSSVDWMYGVLNITLCFAYELRDKGQNGMLLPPEQIIPTGNETLVSIATILEEGKDIIMNEYSWKKTLS